MMNTRILPKGVAVHTRDVARGKDYGWYVRKGDLWLAGHAEEVYRLALRDSSGDTRKLALLNAEKRVGIMLCDMPSERIDHGNRVVYDTLFLEFEAFRGADVWKYASALLVCSPEEYEDITRHATEYAERLYGKPESESEEYRLSAPDPPAGEKVSGTGLSGKRVLPSDPGNFRRCSAYLRASPPEKNRTFVFISTGRVGLERCRQVSEEYDQCLILTMSSEIKSETNLRYAFIKNLFDQANEYIESWIR